MSTESPRIPTADEDIRALADSLFTEPDMSAAIRYVQRAEECAGRTVTRPTPEQDWQRAQALALVAIAHLMLMRAETE